MVYVDPTDVTRTREDDVAAFESFGAGEAEYEAMMDTFRQSFAQAPPGTRDADCSAQIQHDKSGHR